MRSVLQSSRSTPWVDTTLSWDSWPCQGSASGHGSPREPGCERFMEEVVPVNSLGGSGVCTMGLQSWNIWWCVTRRMQERPTHTHTHTPARARDSRKPRKCPSDLKHPRHDLQFFWMSQACLSPKLRQESPMPAIMSKMQCKEYPSWLQQSCRGATRGGAAHSVICEPCSSGNLNKVKGKQRERHKWSELWTLL